MSNSSHIDARTISAGWSSPVAREAHNLEVVSSNLTSATNSTPSANACPEFEPPDTLGLGKYLQAVSRLAHGRTCAGAPEGTSRAPHEFGVAIPMPPICCGGGGPAGTLALRGADARGGVEGHAGRRKTGMDSQCHWQPGRVQSLRPTATAGVEPGPRDNFSSPTHTLDDPPSHRDEIAGEAPVRPAGLRRRAPWRTGPILAGRS